MIKNIDEMVSRERLLEEPTHVCGNRRRELAWLWLQPDSASVHTQMLE